MLGMTVREAMGFFEEKKVLDQLVVLDRETGEAELPKFGETCQMAIPSQALSADSTFRQGRCRD